MGVDTFTQTSTSTAWNGALFMGIAMLILVVFFGIPLSLAVFSNKLIFYIFAGIFVYAFVRKHF